MSTKRINVLLTGIFLLGFLFSGQLISAQSKSTIIEKGILVKTTYKQDIEDGDKKRRIDKVETFNEKGDLVDLKNYDSAGKYAKDWFQYKYDNDGNLIEEIEYDSKQKLKERTVYKYTKGLKVSKEVFDEKERLSRHTTYEYQFKK
jgi:hypothetical protein